MNGVEYLLGELGAKNQLIYSQFERIKHLERWAELAQSRILEMDEHLTDRQRRLVEEAVAELAQDQANK